MADFRQTVYNILKKYQDKFENVSIVLNREIKNDPENYGFIRDNVWGIIKRLNTIDYIINKHLKDFKKTSVETRNILRIGVFQLVFLFDKIPEYAVVNEAVNLAKNNKSRTSEKLINAVLRNIQRNMQEVKQIFEKEESVSDISLKYSYPKWLIEKWQKQFGPLKTMDIIKSNDMIPRLCIRVNTLRISKDKLIEVLKNEGVNTLEINNLPSGLYFDVNPELEKLKSFKEGLFTVQDESSQMVADILAPQESETILDLCCGSGTKTTHIAQIVKNNAKITAVDSSEKRINAAIKSAEKLSVTCAEFIISKIEDIGKFEADRVLIDVPCSGTGVIRKKPDIKWNRSESDILNKYPAMQLKLLNLASKHVKKGGILVYSTCSIEKEENEMLINKFLENNNMFEIEGEFVNILPGNGFGDGFFIAKLKSK